MNMDKKNIVRKSSILKSDFKITLGKVERPDVKTLKVENL